MPPGIGFSLEFVQIVLQCVAINLNDDDHHCYLETKILSSYLQNMNNGTQRFAPNRDHCNVLVCSY